MAGQPETVFFANDLYLKGFLITHCTGGKILSLPTMKVSKIFKVLEQAIQAIRFIYHYH